MQAKLHLWAAGDPGRRFDDLYNLICHPDFLAVAWDRVAGNKGARTPRVDRVIPAFISAAVGDGQGAGADRLVTAPDARGPAAPAQPGAAGWCAYFRHGVVSKATFGYLDAYAWHRVTAWLRKQHRGISWKDLYRRFLTGRPGNRPAENGIIMFDAAQVEVTRYRWRGHNIPTPWASGAAALAAA